MLQKYKKTSYQSHTVKEKQPILSLCPGFLIASALFKDILRVTQPITIIFTDSELSMFKL
jgi:hypothetical protein